MKNSNIAVFPGSFDPLTNGHIDIVTRSLAVFNKVVVAIIKNPAKEALFSVEERIKLTSECFKSYGNSVIIESFSGLLVDFLKAINARVVIRGLRAISDYDYETQMALMNKNLCPELETFFLVAKEENSYVSSTLVKQVAPLGGDVSRLVPAIVVEALNKKLGDNKKVK